MSFYQHAVFTFTYFLMPRNILTDESGLLISVVEIRSSLRSLNSQCNFYLLSCPHNNKTETKLKQKVFLFQLYTLTLLAFITSAVIHLSAFHFLFEVACSHSEFIMC